MEEIVTGFTNVRICGRDFIPGSPSTGSDDGIDTPTNQDFEQLMVSGNGENELSVPPETSFYHGRLDRSKSEERLKTTNKVGSFLIRESDRKPGSYVLSYLGKTGINHFRITAVCGDFYIGGRQFNSLSDLVAQYMHVSDLLKRERLKFPVPPPEPVSDNKKVVAILPYTKMPETDELSFQKGDIFFVHNDLGDGWLWVTAHQTGEQGTIFKDLVEDLDENIDPNTVFPWFHPNISKEEAVDMLVRAGPGSFLVRPSANSPGDYSLFFHINNQIQRFRIEKRGVRYLMGGRTFECLDAVINRYKTEQIVEGHTLGQPLVKCTGENIYATREVSHAEKIYATLRECREMSGLKKKVKMSGWLNKKSDKLKKWKCHYFILLQDGPDTTLFYYDNPKRVKPKGVVDLSCSYLYPVHESYLEKSNCFQIVERALPCLSTVTYLNADSLETCEDWISALQPLCTAQLSYAPKVPRSKKLRSLNLGVLEAHKLPQKLVPNPFCILSLNQVKVCKTKVKTGADPFWDEDFILDDIPPDVQTVTVSVFNRGKRSKDTEVAEVTLDLQQQISGEEVEEWHPLIGVTPVGEWGSIRLRVKFLHDLVMPKEEYSPLQELLLDPELEVVRTLGDLCHSDRTPLAQALLRIFQFEKKEAMLLQTLNELEIQREEETNTLFRSATLTTTLMDLYMRSVCHEFLKVAISEIIFKILETKQSCELNPSKIDNAIEACANAEFLLKILDLVTESIFAAVDFCPKTLRYLCGCLQRCVMTKWPQERYVRTRVVSGFIFLRLLCPAILNPRQFYLLSEPPHPGAARSLIMIAKCLQHLANLVEFSSKEQYMEVINPFILKNKEKMIVFLDQLSSVKEKCEYSEVKLKGDTAKDLGTIHRICLSHINYLMTLSRTRPTVRKLVTVTEMLAKHKQKYMEMMM